MEIAEMRDNFIFTTPRPLFPAQSGELRGNWISSASAIQQICVECTEDTMDRDKKRTDEVFLHEPVIRQSASLE